MNEKDRTKQRELAVAMLAQCDGATVQALSYKTGWVDESDAAIMYHDELHLRTFRVKPKPTPRVPRRTPHPQSGTMHKQARAELRKLSQMPKVTAQLLDALDAKDTLIAELIQLAEIAIPQRDSMATMYEVLNVLIARADE